MAHLITIDQANQELKKGNPVGIPTETVYGLAAPIDNEMAIKQIFAYKKRPLFDPLIVHVSKKADAVSLVKSWNTVADILTDTFWPGPLTLVMEKADSVSDLITAGLGTVGIRLPSHKIAQQLINLHGVPLAAPSANLFGQTSPTTAEHVLSEFTHIDLGVVDGGASNGGIESTIIKIQNVTDPKTQLALLRRGLIPPQKIEAELMQRGFTVEWVQLSGIQAPGQIKHHYMPNVPLVVSKNPNKTWGEIKTIIEKRFNELPNEIDGVKIRKPAFPIQIYGEILLPLDPLLAARDLYGNLRRASESNVQLLLWHQPLQLEDTLWESILERIHKAASLIID